MIIQRISVLLPLLVCTVSADWTKVHTGVGDLSWKLLGKTYQNGKNTVHSSMSISKALAMCLSGAEGETLNAMKSTLGLSSLTLAEILAGYEENTQTLEKIRGSSNSFVLNEANRVYLNTSFQTRDSFVNEVQKRFKSDAKRVNFKAQQESVRGEINKFVANATLNLIPEILADKLDEDTMFAIVNALYFKGKWVLKLSEDKSNTRKFNEYSCPALPASNVNWLFLRKKLKYSESKEISAQIVELPYVSDRDTGVTASMVLILPNESKKCDLATWLKSLSWNDVRSALGSMSPREVMLSIPEVEVESRFKLGDTLKDLGMSVAFSNGANFSKMIQPKSLQSVKIDDVIHQAKLKVDKDGTEAAAATIVIGVKTLSIEIPGAMPVQMVLDRSFVSLIVLRQKGTVVPLFTSVIDTPKR